jgi:FkbM family methyltransferase
MNWLSKLRLYAQAAAALRGPNVQGLPLIPKSFRPSAPANRSAYNQFILWIKRLGLPRAGWIVDVGANHGDFAQAASACHPDAQVLLVEPLPTLHQELERRCRERPHRWRLAPCALGSQPGQATLHIDPQQDGIGSLVGFSPEYLAANPSAQPTQKIACQVRTLDDLCIEHGIQAIDLLKIDVEGFEFETLEGAARALRVTQAILIELSLVRRREDTEPLARLLTLLNQVGLRLVELYPSLYASQAPWLPVEFNVLARRA